MTARSCTPCATASPSASCRAATSYEVVERLRWDGSVDTPLDEASLEPVIARIRDEGSRRSPSA